MAIVGLTIAGSDSGCGAGIQADLRVFQRLGVFGTTAVTAITAQNLDGVSDVLGLPASLVRAQIDAVLGGFPVAALKTGMLWSREIVELVAGVAGQIAAPVVVDPVMVATSGARLLDEGAVAAYRDALLPRAALATPNLDEAAVLLERRAVAREDMFSVAARLHERFGCPVLLKGGHLEGEPVDVLCHDAGAIAWAHARVEGVNTHGTGCMLSAAIAGYLALGQELESACENALAFVHDALARARPATTTQRLADIESATADPRPLRRVQPRAR